MEEGRGYLRVEGVRRRRRNRSLDSSKSLSRVTHCSMSEKYPFARADANVAGMCAVLGARKV